MFCGALIGLWHLRLCEVNNGRHQVAPRRLKAAYQPQPLKKRDTAQPKKKPAIWLGSTIETRLLGNKVGKKVYHKDFFGWMEIV